jgi:murein DD-endopeptidase MepM/ murein hydrolase activator NlpD
MTLRVLQHQVSLAFAFFFALTAAAFAQTPNFAAGLGWRGFAVTGIKATDFAQGDFTVAARFLAQYPLAYVGPILALANTGFVIAKQNEKAALVAEIGGQLYTFPGGSFAAHPSAWHHVALVHAGNDWTLFLDGQRLCADNGQCVMKSGSRPLEGALILGRLSPGVTFDGHEPQFFGLIDDVAVFRKALRPDELSNLAREARLSGAESDLLAGFTFDPPQPGQSQPAALKFPVNFVNLTKGSVTPHPAARPVRISDGHDAQADNASLPNLLPPVQQVDLQLPIPLGESWMVIQGWQGTLSHNGRAAFALDLSLAAEGSSPQNTVATLNRQVFAAAPGKVVQTRNDRTSCEGWPANYVMVEHAPEEVGAYLHFVKGSVAVKSGDGIAAGAYLARAGDTGNTVCKIFHLHFGLHNKPESEADTLVTIPAAFSNYLVSDNRGQSWRHVVRGSPLEKQWLRRCPAADEKLPAGQILPPECH